MAKTSTNTSSSQPQVSQHKRLAMGEKVGFARGGSIMPTGRALKTGIPDTPLEDAKRANGIPGMKKGGRA